MAELRQLQMNLKYRHSLNLYLDPPLVEVSIDEFETFALDRLQGGLLAYQVSECVQLTTLKVLKALESAALRNKSDELLMSTFAAEQKEYLPLSSTSKTRHGSVVDVDEERRKDHISHFILRLAYCRR
jgi:DNA primase large subunit